MMKNFLTNRKGTAEVIGSVLFIVIILFFFSNVYLWHDQATREMNTLYSDKMNSPITVETTTAPENGPGGGLIVTNKGGVAATLSVLWLNVTTDPVIGPGRTRFDLSNLPNNVVFAGSSVTIPLNDNSPYSPTFGLDTIPPGMTVTFKVITTVGNSAACSFKP